MTGDGNVCTVEFRVRFDEAGPDGLVRTSTLLRYAQDLASYAEPSFQPPVITHGFLPPTTRVA